jgi:WD40 repeat protein
MSYNEIAKLNVPVGVTCINLEPTKRTRIAAGFNDGSIVLYDILIKNDSAEFKEIKRDNIEEHYYSINSLSWSPDGTKIVSGNSDGGIQIWNAETLEIISTLRDGNINVSSVAWSPDSTRIVSGSTVYVGDSDRSGHVVIWDAATYEIIKTLGEGDEEPNTNILTVSWRPNGEWNKGEPYNGMEWIESSGDDGIIYSWGVGDETGEGLLSYVEGNDSNIKCMCMAFNAEGTRIAYGLSNGELFSQNPETGDNIVNMKGHTSSVNSLCWSRNGNVIVSGSSDNSVRVWNAADGSQKNILNGHDNEVTSVAISYDNNYIFSAGLDKTIRVWVNSIQIATQQFIKKYTEDIINRTLRKRAYRPEGFFGEEDPGGIEFQAAKKRWNLRNKSDGGKKRKGKTNKKKHTKKRKTKKTISCTVRRFKSLL